MYNKKHFTSFLAGYASIFDLFPARRAESSSRFMFRGVDLSKITAAEAIEQDWRMVGSSLAAALDKMSEQNDEGREAERDTR